MPLIIFDCDGVLVDSEILSRRATAAVLQEAGIPATPAMIAPFTGMKQQDIMARIAAATGIAVAPAVAERIWPALQILFRQELQAVAGVDALLDHLPWPRCVASSSHPERIRESLALTGLARHFGDAVFSSLQVRNGKPAPDLFLFAAERMGAVPADCVVIEDSIAGVRAARAAAMAVVAFAGASHADAAHRQALEAERPDLVLDSFDGAQVALAGLLGPAGAAQDEGQASSSMLR